MRDKKRRQIFFGGAALIIALIAVAGLIYLMYANGLR
jgi:hypothetical protein